MCVSRLAQTVQLPVLLGHGSLDSSLPQFFKVATPLQVRLTESVAAFGASFLARNAFTMPRGSHRCYFLSMLVASPHSRCRLGFQLTQSRGGLSMRQAPKGVRVLGLARFGYRHDVVGTLRNTSQ